MSDFSDETSQSFRDLAAVLARRAEPMLNVMSQPASAVLLIGDPGVGKLTIAEHVARAVENLTPGTVQPFIFSRPTVAGNDPKGIFAGRFPNAFLGEEELPFDSTETFEAVKLAEELITLARSDGDGAEPLLVLPGIDRYSPRSIALLKQLIRQRGARIIGTADRFVGGATHMGREPRVRRLPVGPLDLSEADALLASMLGNARIATPTLRRWHVMTGGNAQALTMMLVENERRGSLKHGRSVARVAPGEDLIPDEYVHTIHETCTEKEFEILEMIAYAEPLSEPPLLRLIDSTATRNLMDRDLISTRTLPNGSFELCISRPILASALRTRMSPVRRIEIADEFFRALTTYLPEAELLRSPSLLIRAVEIGLESGAAIPHDWLVTAVAGLLVHTNPLLMLRVSLALARGYRDEHAAAAALRALSTAVQLGDEEAAESARSRIDELAADDEAFRTFPRSLQTRLRLAQIERRFWLGAPLGDAFRALDEYEQSLGEEDRVAREAIRGLRFQLALRDGNFNVAAELMLEHSDSGDLMLDWVRAPAISAGTLLMQQQGHLEEAISAAARARNIVLVGRRPLNDTLELQGLHWFLGYWANGDAGGARAVLKELEQEAEAGGDSMRLIELTEVGWAMLALLEARWRNAADLVELFLESSHPNDPYGLVPLLNAVQALALAALGEREGAVEQLRRARENRRGISQAFAGFRLRVALQAQQWLRLGNVGEDALELASWAAERRLHLVEIQALHVAAVESQVLARQVRDRASEIANEIDPLIADAVLSHIVKIAEGASPTDVSEAEVLLLSDLGLWIPLPKSSSLSAREREIALAAAFNFSSRAIAERYHLSTRTVETHLANIYLKLGVADRGELREWFSAARRFG